MCWYPPLMLQTSARLLRLLSLLQARRFWTGPELAARTGVTGRTLRRDIDRLRSLGYPIDAAAGVAGGYRLGTGAVLPPLLLEDDEALAVILGLRSAAAGGVTGVEEATLRALTKLDQLLPARLRRRMKGLHSAVVPLHWSGPSVDAEWLTISAGACRDHELLRFRYEDRQARGSERTIEPHGLVHSGRLWYLVGWDLARADFRTFRVDRLQAKPIVVNGRRFNPRAIPGGDLATYVSRSVSTQAYTFAARVIVHAPRARVAERVPPLAGRVEALDAGRCVLETGGNHLGMLAMHIAQLGFDFEVLEPPELIEHLRTLGKTLARAARARAKQPALKR
jgi:predicted DNA-binding transcriptional regulator YafY